MGYYRQLNREKVYPDHLRRSLRGLNEEAVNFVCALLTLDPPKRLSAQKALDHDFFWKDPMPCDPSRLASFNYASSHEFVTKKRRNEQREKKKAATAAAQGGAAEQNGDKRQRR